MTDTTSTPQPNSGGAVSTPPGWYPDNTAAGRERYWDGSTWTDQSRDAAGGSPAGTGQVLGDGQKKKRGWVMPAVIGAVGFILGVGAGTTSAGGNDGSAGAAAAPTVTVTAASDGQPTATVTVTPPAATETVVQTVTAPAAAPVAGASFSDGTYVVGVDIEPGTYRPTDNVSDSCYWGIYRTGSNGEDIIQNDFPGGGRPQLTLKQGQDVSSNRCGTWAKQ